MWDLLLCCCSQQWYAQKFWDFQCVYFIDFLAEYSLSTGRGNSFPKVDNTIRNQIALRGDKNEKVSEIKFSLSRD